MAGGAVVEPWGCEGSLELEAAACFAVLEKYVCRRCLGVTALTAKRTARLEDLTTNQHYVRKAFTLAGLRNNFHFVLDRP